MVFLDPNNLFQSITGRYGILYFSGQLNKSWNELLLNIENNVDIKWVRGNFAFVYLPNIENHKNINPIFAVDHLSSIPIFYSQNLVSYKFSNLVDMYRENNHLEFNKDFFWESMLFWGFTISERTPVKGIKRVRPGRYIQNNIESDYLNFNSLISDEPLNTDEFKNIIENFILKSTKTNSALLSSGGTDSAVLVALIKKLNLEEKFTIVSVKSKSDIQNENFLLDKLAAKLSLKVNYFNSDQIQIRKVKSKQVAASEMIFWKDYSFFYRNKAINSFKPLKFDTIITGECGDQLFGGPKLSKMISLLLQNPKVSANEIAKQFIHLCMRESTPEWQGYKESPLINWYLKIDPDKNLFKNIYEESISTISSVFQSMQTDDQINKLLNLNLLFKGPYRLFHYSQDTNNYVHPFSNWNIVSLALKTRSKDKIYNKGRLKEVYYQAYKDYLIEDIWNAPKTGTTIPIKVI